jgi:hypothetical protein
MKWFDIADELLPPAYKAIKDVYAYAKSLNGELTVWTSYLERILKNFFVQTCDIQTVEYWEHELGITPFGSETLDERREVILEHLNNQNAITEPYVRHKIEQMFHGDVYRLWFDVEHDKPFDLHIEIYTRDVDSFIEFSSWANKMCPAHLSLNLVYSMEAEEVDPVAHHTHVTWERCNLGTIGHIDPPTFNVTLTPGEGYTLTPSPSSHTPVEYGGSFEFTLSISQGYYKADGFAVKANEETITGTNDVYTIENIRSDVVVTIQGVEVAGTLLLGMMTSSGDVKLKFAEDLSMAQPDVRTYPFVATQTLQPGIMSFPTVTLYPSVPGANMTFGDANTRLLVNSQYPMYPPSSSTQYTYESGMIAVAYTNYALHNASSYASTEHWLYGSDSWEAKNDFIVWGSSSNRLYITNQGSNVRLLTGILIAHIDGDYDGLKKIQPIGTSGHEIYAAYCVVGSTKYYWPMLEATTKWMTVSELTTAGFEVLLDYRNVRKITNGYSSAVALYNGPSSTSGVKASLPTGDFVYGEMDDVVEDQYQIQWQKVKISLSGVVSEVYVNISGSQMGIEIISVPEDFNMVVVIA